MKKLSLVTFAVALAATSFTQAPSTPAAPQAPGLPVERQAERTPSIVTKGNVLIKNGRLLTVTRGFLDGQDLLILNGKIARVGGKIDPPAGVTVVDAQGKFVTPGLVDAHSHRASDATNEGTDAIVSEVRIRDVLDSEDKGIWDGLASGITTSLILHGSANPIGGQSSVIKMKWQRPTRELLFPGAPNMVKFALGENPKGSNGRDQHDPVVFPQSRTGVEAVYRRAFADAKDYMRQWEEYRKDPSKTAAPRRDLRLESLADILTQKTWVQCHSYRQDEMLMMLRLSQEFGFKLVFQHALEAYKIAPELAAAKVPVSMFGDGFAYKIEVLDSIPMGTTISDMAGVLTSVNTDTSSGVVPLTQDAGKAMRYGLDENRALRLITLNPAIQLGVDRMAGSLEVGKDGDIAIWQGHPLSVYTKCTMTLVDGEVAFQRRDPFKVDGRSMAATAVASRPFDPDRVTVPKKATSYILNGATLHPVSGPPTKGSLLIQNGRIAAVGGKIEATANAVVVDARGMHVYPGMIDAGSQIGLQEVGATPSATDVREVGEFQPDLRALTAVNPDTEHIPKVRYNGVTSTRVRTTGPLFAGQGAVIDLLGYNKEEFTVDPLNSLDVYVPEGLSSQFRDALAADEVERLERGIRDRQRALREHFERGQRYLRAKAAGESLPTDVKLEALRPYLEGQKPVVFHANRVPAIRTALRLAKDFGLKAILAGAPDSWKVAKEIAAAKVSVILDPPSIASPDSTSPQSDLDPYDAPFAAATILRDAGVKVAFQSSGTDAAMNLPYAVGRMCAFGLPHDAAVRALTLDAAEVLGVADKLGSLERGKVANVIVTDGDPLELTTKLRYLFINGQPVPLESKYTELYRKYRARVK
jgi:imidazolonepropionase-like amidohydrolase